MIEYRSFRNSDPPHLAEIWRSQPPDRGTMQPMSAELFEQLILSKCYFENDGLIVAVDAGQPVGFAHAGFGPTEDEQRLSRELGTTCLVMVRASHHRQGIGAELLARSEAFLISRGAKVLYGGAIRPLNPFYLGLYGGSELPGILDSSVAAQQLFAMHGYRPIDRVVVLERTLAGYRPPMDRKQIQVRRRANFEMLEDPPTCTWWEACTEGAIERTLFQLVDKTSKNVLATAMFWDLEPLASSWGVHAAGLMRLDVIESERRQGLGTVLVAESLRHLQSQGITLVEVQTMESNVMALGLYRKFGFEIVDHGTVYRKQ